MPTSLGPAEILVILVVALLVLGPERLPKAARQLGRAMGEVRRWSSNVQDDLRSAIDVDDERVSPIASVPDPPPLSASPDDEQPPPPPAAGLPTDH